MKAIGVLVITVFSFGSGWAFGYSIINCHAQNGTSIQVYLNGHLVNKQPNEAVRVRSSKGCNSIIIKVFEKSGLAFFVQKDLSVEMGYEFYLKVDSDECGSAITISTRYPLFSNYLYNKNLYASQNIS